MEIEKTFINRRIFLKSGALITLASSTGFGTDFVLKEFNNNSSSFSLPDLPYNYTALEPYIDAKTMEIHHSQHHKTYVTNLNNAVAGTGVEKLSLSEICKNISNYPMSVRNNAGGHFNHSFFWSIMKPASTEELIKPLSDSINDSFGSLDQFKEKFKEVAMNIFGSGWAWLVVNKNKLEIISTANQDNPLMDISSLQGIPVLGLDVWEHAYYLKHQNKRIDYINAWWKVVNWQEVNRRFIEAGS